MKLRMCLYADPVKTVLFLKGAGMNGDNIGRLDNDFAKALMIEPKMIDDPYVQNCIYQMIKNRINEAKVGVLKSPRQLFHSMWRPILTLPAYLWA